MANSITVTTNATFIVGAIVDDMTNSVVATITLAGTSVPIQLTLWRDNAYQAIGNWTNDQAIAEITALLNNGSGG
jgi:hypothetical protein